MTIFRRTLTIYRKQRGWFCKRRSLSYDPKASHLLRETSLATLFDSYNRQARLYPALLTFFPLLAFFLLNIPSAAGAPQSLVGLAISCGALFFLADYARSRGKRLEQELLIDWGGWPTTIF